MDAPRNSVTADVNNEKQQSGYDEVQAIKVFERLEAAKYTKPCTPQQIDLNDNIDCLLLPNNRTMLLDFVTSLDSKLSDLFISHIPETGAVQHKNTTAYYSHTTAYINSDEYKQIVSMMFDNKSLPVTLLTYKCQSPICRFVLVILQWEMDYFVLYIQLNNKITSIWK